MRPHTTAETLLKSWPSANKTFPLSDNSRGALTGSWLRICLAKSLISSIRPGLFSIATLLFLISDKSTKAPNEMNLFANGFLFFSSVATSQPRRPNSCSKDSWADSAEARGSSWVKSSKNSTVVR